MTVSFSRVRRFFRECATALMNDLAPTQCPGCGVVHSTLCGPCRASLVRISEPLCDRCGLPLDPLDSDGHGDHRDLAHITIARAPFAYCGTGGSIVRRLKFQRDLGSAEYLSRAMAVALRPWVDVRGRRAMLVSVPMHPRKRRSRGIDQAAFLAERVAQRLGLRYLPRVLRRTRETLPQGDPRVTSRAENVRDAFGLWHPWPLLGQRRLLGQTIILVDDVRSSGSTARSCAYTLRSAGASCVVLVTGSVS